MKTFLKIALLLIVVLGVTLYLSSGLIKRFVADRVEALVAGYLNPELVIEDFTYVFPFTVKVSNLKLVQDGVDAIVQCGTNLSMVGLSDRLEKELGLPIIPINTACLWFAMRENGFNDKLENCTRLFRDF